MPSDEEWDKLIEAVGGSYTAGTKLKAKSGWNDDEGKSGNGTDNYGFSALPGGYGHSDVDFEDVGDEGYWWGTTEVNASYIGGRNMSNNLSYVYRLNYNKSGLFSVRCVKD